MPGFWSQFVSGGRWCSGIFGCDREVAAPTCAAMPCAALAMPSCNCLKSRALDLVREPGGWNAAGVSPTCSYPLDMPKRDAIVTGDAPDEAKTESDANDAKTVDELVPARWRVGVGAASESSGTSRTDISRKDAARRPPRSGASALRASALRSTFVE